MQVTVDDYLDQTPEPQKTTLQSLRETLRDLRPEASESISYGMPAVTIEGKAIAGYGSFKDHCSYFPHSGSVLPTLADELTHYQWTKGTLRFPVDAPLPRGLVKKLVDRRLEQLGTGFERPT